MQPVGWKPNFWPHVQKEWSGFVKLIGAMSELCDLVRLFFIIYDKS